MRSELDDVIASGVSLQHFPFAVGVVANAEGVLWQGTAGPAKPSLVAGLDTQFRIYSQTKAVGSIAAIMLVERGLLSMDTPVQDVLPEFRDIQVLESFDSDGQPVLRPPRTTCTLRHLLTHTSGFAYATFHINQLSYEALPGAPVLLSGLRSGFDSPLMFDPGDDFVYGIGIDWAGFMVERIDGRRIDRYCYEEILGPLGMSDTVFELEDRSRLADLKIRVEDGSFADIEYELPVRPEAYGMGMALYSTAQDYVRLLRMLLNDGVLDGNRILGSRGMELVKNRQTPLSVPVFRSVMPFGSADVDFFPGTKMSWTASFLRNEEDIPGRRAAGSLTWAGFLNTHHWIDPTNDLVGLLMTQTLPFCDPGFMTSYREFETVAYREFATAADPVTAGPVAGS